MRNRNVLISGAGPAGMTLAYWLRRHGFSPTVESGRPRRGTAAKPLTSAARRSKLPGVRGFWMSSGERARALAGCPTTTQPASGWPA